MAKTYLFKFLSDILAGVFYTCALINWSFLGFGMEGDDGSLQAAALGWGMFFIATGLFEVPTGYIADRYGHKASTIAGTLALSLVMLAIPLYSHPLWLASTAFAAGVALTLVSGAKTAWLYQLRPVVAPALDGDSYLVRLELIRRAALVIAAVAGGWLTVTDPAAVWLIAGGTGLVAVTIGVSLPDGSAAQPAAAKPPSLMTAVAGVRRHGIMPFYVASGVFALGFGVHDIWLQPHIIALSTHLPQQLMPFALGIVFGGMHACAFAGGLLYSRAIASSQSQKARQVARGLAITCLLLSGSYLAAITAQGFWRFAIIWCLCYSAMSWFYPLRSFYILERVPPELSATFLSLDEAIDGLIRGSLAIGIAFALSQLTAASFWLAGIAALLLAAVLYSRAGSANWA